MLISIDLKICTCREELHFWLDLPWVNMTGHSRHAYITSWTSLKLLPGPIRFTQGFSKRYILLKLFLFETRLHHWLNQLEVITYPGLVLSIQDNCVSLIHESRLRCTHMRCKDPFTQTILLPLNMCIDIRKSLAHRKEHIFVFRFKTSRFNQFFIFKSHLLPQSKISN